MQKAVLVFACIPVGQRSWQWHLKKECPLVLSRQRLQLVETFSFKFRQPFHTAEKMRPKDASKFISGVRTAAEHIAYCSLHAVQLDLKKLGYQLDRVALLLASGKPLPELEKILHSHTLIHTADGELFREALRRASTRCGLQIAGTKERGLLEQCTEVFSLKAPELLRGVTELGRSFGSPWSQDEKFATLAAWLVFGPVGR